MQPRITEYLELTENRHPDWHELRQVRLIKRMPDRGWIMEGTLGGWVSSMDNLEGQAWIDDGVKIFNEFARVTDKAMVLGNVRIWGHTKITDNAYIRATGEGVIHLKDSVTVKDDAQITGAVYIEGSVEIGEYACVGGKGIAGLHIAGNGIVLTGHTIIKGYGVISGATTITDGRFRGALHLIDANLSRTDHLLTVDPVGSEEVIARLYRTEGGGHMLSVGCWEGTVYGLDDEVRRRAQSWHADEEQKEHWKKQYKLLKQMCELTIEGWDETGQ